MAEGRLTKWLKRAVDEPQIPQSRRYKDEDPLTGQGVHVHVGEIDLAKTGQRGGKVKPAELPAQP